MSSIGFDQQTSPRLSAAEASNRSTTTVADSGTPTVLPHRHPPPPPPRQIRFVSTDGQPHLKRKRINAACRTCRKRKTRCSGERPVCATCRQNGHACLGYAEAGQNQPSPDPLDQTGESREDDEDDREGGSEREITPLRSEPSSPIERRDLLPETLLSGGALPDLTRCRSHFTTPQGSQRSAREVLPAGNDYDAAPDRVTALRDVSSPVPNDPGRSSRGTGSRIPYFRYFGPTAVISGSQDVPVQVNERRKSKGAHPSSAVKSSKSTKTKKSSQAGKRGSVPAGVATPSSHLDKPARSMDVQFYDTNGTAPTPLIVNQLVETFFIRLGCNFPFLQREPFQEYVTKKTVETILVDAVCAVAARFSIHPILVRRDKITLTTEENDSRAPTSNFEYGQPFAKRAKSSLANSLSRPSLAAVQACLLLAYEEYGRDQESGVWMYLGIAIRMAQDLGMQKLKEAGSDGRGGPTPRTAKYAPGDSGQDARKVAREESKKKIAGRQEQVDTDDQEVLERQRTDTLWTLFFLDRVVSSSTGRPVTLRDKDVELSFPSQDETESQSGWPAPFPSILRIIHLYGRITDLLSHPRVIKSTTQDILVRLAGMEKDLTGIYQRLSPQLHFNPANFQHYTKIQQGTSFLSLHFWFHALIILIHQPTLLHAVDSRIQLLSNSREVCMTSAKTIADILAFAELFDARCFIGNPFSGAPMYLAACAFLMECSLHLSSVATMSEVSPSRQMTSRANTSKVSKSTERHTANIIPRRSSLKSMSPKTATNTPDLVEGMADKHRVLLIAALQNYRRCYKALKTLEVYWAGAKATITELDQKATNIIGLDPYMSEVTESTRDLHPSSPMRTPSQRTRDSSRTQHGTSGDALVPSPAVFVALPGRSQDMIRTPAEVQATSGAGATEAVGWTLNGTTGSPSSNLTLVYPASVNVSSSIASDATSLDNRPRLDLVFQEGSVGIDNMPQHVPIAGNPSMQMPSFGLDQFMAAGLSQDVRDQLGLVGPAMSQSSLPGFSPLHTDQINASDSEMLFDPNSRYTGSPAGPLPTLSPVPGPHFQDLRAMPPVQSSPPQRQTYHFPPTLQQPPLQQHPYAASGGIGFPAGLANAGIPMYDPSSNMMIGSQDMEMSALGGEVAPWLDYLPQDYLALYNAGDQHDQPSDRQQVQQSGDGTGGIAPGGPPGSQAE